MGDFKPIQPWEVFWRSAFSAEHGDHNWSVAVEYWDAKDQVGLYREGKLVGKQSPPAKFSLPPAVNSVLSWLGLAAAIDRALSMKYNPWLD